MIYKMNLIGTAIFVASLNPQAVSAQDSQDSLADDGNSLGEIIVTAQRREESLQKTPVTVTALTGAALEDRGISQVQNLARSVPNLQLLPVTANPSTLQVGLRGGAEQAGGLIVSEPVVGIYVDDVYRARLQGSNAQLGDIERVEILRGPQGTLYGRNNFSGAIKIITKTPSSDNEWTNFSIGAGSFDEVSAQASIGRGLSDSVGASVSVLYRDMGDGWIYNRAQDRDIGKEGNIVVRGKIAYEEGGFDVVASATYSRDRNEGYIPVAVSLPYVPSGRNDFLTDDDAVPRFGNDPYIAEYPQESLGRTETIALSLNGSYDFGAVTLRSITGYVDLEDDFRWDLTSGREVAAGVYSAAFDRFSQATANQFTQEIQLSGQALGERLDYIFGAFYFHESGDQSLTDNIPLFFLFNLEPTFLAMKTDSYAVFAQGTYDLTDRLSATVGLRYTEDKKTFDASIQTPFGPDPRAFVSLDETFDSFTPKFGLDYQFSDNIFGYASVSKGFKAGGFNGLAVVSPLVLQQSYGPQSVWSYEVGLKSDLFNRRLRANLTAFYNDISGLQQTGRGDQGSFPTQNVGDARLWGVEAEFTANPTRGVTLFTNIGYQNDKYKSLVPGATAAIAEADSLPLVSDWTVQAGFNIDLPVSDNFEVRFGADAVYVGDYFFEVTNGFLIEGYTRYNGFVSFGSSDGTWNLKVAAQNITDEENYVSGSANLPLPALTILKPRTIMATLSYSM